MRIVKPGKRYCGRGFHGMFICEDLDYLVGNVNVH
jgi:hypothetical protein